MKYPEELTKKRKYKHTLRDQESSSRITKMKLKFLGVIRHMLSMLRCKRERKLAAVSVMSLS